MINTKNYWNRKGDCAWSCSKWQAEPETMNHFQRLNVVKESKIFFFAQRANTRKQALSSDALAPTVQNCAGAVLGWSTRQRAEDQQLYIRTSMTSWAHCGSLSKRRELVLSSYHPPPPRFFCPILGPRSLTFFPPSKKDWLSSLKLCERNNAEIEKLKVYFQRMDI